MTNEKKKRARGRKEFERHLRGERLTPSEAILAKCYICRVGYADGKYDCVITMCSLYPFMPYEHIKNPIELNMDDSRQTPVYRYGIRAKGRREMIKHWEGKKLTKGGAILANCYDCQGGYTGGKNSCLKPECPLFPFMPYKDIE